MSHPTVPRPFERWLQAVLGSHRASTSLGDLEEELAARGKAGRPVRFVRLWWLRHVAALTTAAGLSAAPRSVRATGYAIRDAVRGLRAAPRATAVALLILTLGMAAATVTFSVVDHVVLRRLPLPDDHRLVVVSGITPRGRTLIVSPQDYFGFRQGVPAFEHVSAWRGGGTVSLEVGGVAEPAVAITATASLFDVLGIRPTIGRAFGAEHEHRGSPRVVVLSHALWQRRFGGDPNVIGRSVVIGGTPHEILGVMPSGVEFPVGVAQPAGIWRPYVPEPDDSTYTAARGRSRYLQILGRLRDGATIEQAAAQVDAVTASLAAQAEPLYRDWRVRVEWLRDALVTGVRGWMLLVLGAVALVLLVACVNVANLQLARSAVRAREFAVRAALGATRARLVQSMLIENVMLSLVAGAAGLVTASWAIGLVKTTLPDGISRASLIALDGRVFAAALGAALATGAGFGLVPALQASRTEILAVLKTGMSSGSIRARRRWRSGLMVAQIGLMVMLLVATSLLIASFVRIMRADLGFARTNLVGIRLSPSWRGVAPAERPARSRQLFQQAKGILEEVPGVTRVALLAGAELPLYRSSASMRLGPPGVEPSTAPSVDFRRASEDYLEAAGMQLLEGRWFRDTDGDMRAVVLDELAATQLFGESPAVGQTVLVGEELTPVIGIVETVRFEGPESEPRPQMYLPWSLSGTQGGSPMIVVRTSRRPTDVVPAIRSVLAPLLPAGTPPPDITIVDELYRELTSGRRFAAGLMSMFGALALLIGAAGIYSVMASVVAQQTREIGIRCALGATRSRIATLVLFEAGRHVAIGLAIGLAAAWAVSGIFSSLVFGVTPTEPLLYSIVAVVLAVVGLAAAWMPARRASRVDPIVALRE